MNNPVLIPIFDKEFFLLFTCTWIVKYVNIEGIARGILFSVEFGGALLYPLTLDLSHLAYIRM